MGPPRFDTVLTFHGVRDLVATRDFYERDLGLRLERDQGRCLIFAAGAGYVGFCQLEDPRVDGRPAVAVGAGAASDDGGDASRGGTIITFVTDEVDAVHGRLRRLGAELEGPPRHHPAFGIYHFFARDPDGHLVEVQRFDEPLR